MHRLPTEAAYARGRKKVLVIVPTCLLQTGGVGVDGRMLGWFAERWANRRYLGASLGCLWIVHTRMLGLGRHSPGGTCGIANALLQGTSRELFP